MSLRVVNVDTARIVAEKSVVDRKHTLDFYSYALSNIVLGNNISSPAIELLHGKLVIESNVDTVAAVIGNAKVIVNGVEVSSWRAFPLPKGSKLIVEALTPPIYLSFMQSGALVEGASLPYTLKSGEKFHSDEVSLKDVIDELPARYVPSRYRPRRRLSVDIRVVVHELLHEKRELIERGLVVLRNIRDRVVGIFSRSRVAEGFDEGGGEGFGTVYESGDRKIVVLDSSKSADGTPIGYVLPTDVDELVRARKRARVTIRYLFKRLEMRHVLEYMMRLRRVKDVIDAAVNACLRGASKVTVKIGSREYDVWIEEVP